MCGIVGVICEVAGQPADLRRAAAAAAPRPGRRGHRHHAGHASASCTRRAAWCATSFAPATCARCPATSASARCATRPPATPTARRRRSRSTSTRRSASCSSTTATSRTRQRSSRSCSTSTGATSTPSSDTEVLINVLAHELERAARDRQRSPEEVFAAVAAVHKRIEGSYAVVALIAGHGLLAFRDPFGIRPLVFGEGVEPGGPEVMVASESVAHRGHRPRADARRGARRGDLHRPRGDACTRASAPRSRR